MEEPTSIETLQNQQFKCNICNENFFSITSREFLTHIKGHIKSSNKNTDQETIKTRENEENIKVEALQQKIFPEKMKRKLFTVTFVDSVTN